jgi:hypothetical protein
MMAPDDSERLIGYYGHPPREVLDRHRVELRLPLVDLDVGVGAPDSGLTPDTCCQIITNIIDNAIDQRDRLAIIIADVGEAKCDQGRFAARLLADVGLPIVETHNHALEPRHEIAIATSRLPLREKILRIMDTVHAEDCGSYEQCEPVAGFWGVPPHDLSLLDLFPDDTHVYGWTRCVEASVPADLELECHVDEGVPTIFYAQAFCAKQLLARHLAQQHRGLYVDADGPISASVAAKVEAFLRLA